MANGNGNKVVVLNTRERVLSTDANRAQSFYGQSVADLLRFMLDASSEESRFGGGYEVMSTGSETVPRAYVVNGIRPQPVNGTTSLLITPGVIALVDNPTPTADESPMAWIDDPGISVVGVLTLPANGSGLTIIGVVECQRSTVILEQDNRDVFNQSTGLFSPVLVNKVTTGRLIYRIRLGTPGAGFPGTAAGWVPLAVFNQPAAATTWDDVLLMWDVRPMVNDRWNAPFNTPLSVSEEYKGFAYTNTAVVGSSKLYSELDVNYLQSRAGGRCGLVDPSATSGFFDVQNVASRAANFGGYGIKNWWHVYAIFPFGLPRWQPYSTSATVAPRRPIGARGILAVTNVGPTFNGIPSANISTPTSTGLQDTPGTSAVSLISGETSDVPEVQPVLMDGRTAWGFFGATRAATSTTTTLATWTLADNVSHPGNARAIWVNFSADFTTGAVVGPTTFEIGALITVTSGDNLGTYFCQGGVRSEVRVETGAGITYTHTFAVRVPLGHNGFSSPRTFTLKWTYAFSGTLVASALITVLGWDPGP